MIRFPHMDQCKCCFFVQPDVEHSRDPPKNKNKSCSFQQIHRKMIISITQSKQNHYKWSQIRTWLVPFTQPLTSHCWFREKYCCNPQNDRHLLKQYCYSLGISVEGAMDSRQQYSWHFWLHATDTFDLLIKQADISPFNVGVLFDDHWLKSFQMSSNFIMTIWRT